MNIMDFDVEESDCDSEIELQDLQQLNAVLTSDEPSPGVSSQIPSPTESEYSSSRVSHELSKIDAALSLNKLYDEKLKRLETVLMGRLHECNQKLSDIIESNKNNKSVSKQESFRYVYCGKPYFKDKSNFTPPHNEDTLTMLRSGMYDFSSVSSVPGWTVKDKTQFLNLLHKMSIEIRKKEKQSKISELKREMKSKPSKKIEESIAALLEEIVNINKKSLNDLALPINQEYDWDEVAVKLNGRHSAEEYQNLWKLFLHPSINKSTWSRSEHTALQKIANQNKYQAWDEIANKLGTKRSGYQCFVYFRTNMSNTFTGQKWTKEEEEYLKRLIDYYREDNYIPWGKVATSMENRTKIQIYNKYYRLNEHRKGRFLAEEDAVILTFVDNFGLDFIKMTSYLPGRSSAQLRNRYRILGKKRISTVWTEEEDNRLIKLLANENSPSVFSSLTKHFPGKDRMNIRSRYVTLVKWMRSNPNSDISRAPRRAARRLGHGQALGNLNKAIENLKKRIQSEVEKHKCKKITKNSPENIIDDAIMATLVNQINKEEENRRIQEWEDELLVLEDDSVISAQSLNATNLRKLLILFKARLNKTQLYHSKYCKAFPDLLNGERDVSLVNVKSYSRKDKMKTVVTKIPDIFGVNTFGELEYVLPPHYATITGCRQLMAWLPDKKLCIPNDFNINVLLRKSVPLKEHFFALLERFNSMFLWPMLLSNESPKLNKVVSTRYNSNRPLPKSNDQSLMISLGIAIPKMKTHVINENIDLEVSENDDEKHNLIEIDIDKITMDHND